MNQKELDNAQQYIESLDKRIFDCTPDGIEKFTDEELQKFQLDLINTLKNTKSIPDYWLTFDKNDKLVMHKFPCCCDCGKSYNDPDWLDMTIPDQQWKIICPEYEYMDVILCANCIGARMKKHGTTVILGWADQLMEDKSEN